MRTLSLLSASALLLALGAGSAFAIPSSDRLANPTTSVPGSSYSAPAGHYSGFTALAPANGDNGTQYSPLPVWHRGQ